MNLSRSFVNKVFEFLCPVSEVERVGNPLGFSLCLPASPLVVPVVTVPFSDANLDCEVVFSDSGCEFVEPQTLSPFRNREASVALERETDMNIEGPPVKAVPKAVRNRPSPQSSLLKAVPECVRSKGLWRWSTRYETQSLTSFTLGDCKTVSSLEKMEDYLARKREDIWYKTALTAEKQQFFDRTVHRLGFATP